MGREHLIDTRDRPGARVPNKDDLSQYGEHVHMRTRVCFLVWLRAAKYMQSVGIEPQPGHFSDKAEVQVGSGFRNVSSGSQDAAHYMNTSFRPGTVDSNWQGNGELSNLYRTSGATSNQFQTSNVSADKVIDAVQTLVKNKLFTTLTKATSINREFVREWVKFYLVTVLSALQSKQPMGAPTNIKEASYSTAYNSIATQIRGLESIVSDVLGDLA